MHTKLDLQNVVSAGVELSLVASKASLWALLTQLQSYPIPAFTLSNPYFLSFYALAQEASSCQLHW